MPVDYQPTDLAVASVVDRMLMAHHPDYCQDGKVVKVDTIFAVAEHGEGEDTDANPVVVGGFNQPAKTIIRSLRERREGHGDILIIIDRHWWEDAGMNERDTEIDQQLSSVKLKLDSESKIKHDKAFRPCLEKRRPDKRIDVYHDVVARHHQDARAWKEVKEIVDKHGQSWFGWSGDNDPRGTVDQSVLPGIAADSLAGGSAKERNPDEVKPAVLLKETKNAGRKSKRSKTAAETIAGESPDDIAKRTKAWNDSQRPPVGQAAQAIAN